MDKARTPPAVSCCRAGRRALAALLVLHASPTSGFFTSRAPAYRPHATGSLHPAFQQPLSLSATMASPTAINAEAHDSGVSSHTGHEHSIKRSSVSQDLAAEPFELVRTDLKDLKNHIKELVDRQIGSKDKTMEGSTNPLLKEAAREFFERRERAWRPGTVLLLARALGASAEAAAAEEGDAPGISEGQCKPNAKQLQLAEIVEMMATAQVIHDDVLEDMDVADAGNVAHRMYSSELGNKVSLLAGDFLLARSSVQLARLTNTEVVSIIGTSLENMCRGDVMAAMATPEDHLSLAYYFETVSLKTASLLADACRCTAILAGHSSDSEAAAAAWRYGHHLACSYQITADIAAYRAGLAAAAAAAAATTTAPPMEKKSSDGASAPQPADAKSLLLAIGALPPFVLAAADVPSLHAFALAAASGEDEEGAAAKAVEILQGPAGQAALLAAEEAAVGHRDEAAAAALTLAPSTYRDGLLVLAEYVVEEDQRGLQRAKWVELQAKKAKEAAKAEAKEAKEEEKLKKAAAKRA